MQGQKVAFSEISVGPTQLRVISDGSANIATMVAAEKRVILSLAERGLWRHDTVTLFVMENLAPLVGQLRQLHNLDDREAAQLPQRPMVNLYDLHNPRECFVFVNIQVMRAEGYWDDALVAEGLFAHEHAHPIGECPAIAAARLLRVAVEAPNVVMSLLAQLGSTLSVGAISELLANDVCIANGFDAALAHIDRKVIDRAVQNLSQRPELQRRLTAAESLNIPQRRLLLLLADAQIVLPFAIELAPFVRTGHPDVATEIEDILHSRLLPQLDPGIREIFFALHTLFLHPRPEWEVTQTRTWCREVLAMLSAAFARCGSHVVLHLSDEEIPYRSMRTS